MDDCARRWYMIVLCVLCCMTAEARTKRSIRERHSVDFMSTHNTLQVESYINFQVNNGQYTIGYPAVLFRFGLIKQLEIRLAVELSSILDRVAYSGKTGLNPLQPGFKYRLLNPKGFRPAMAFTASIVIPHAATESFKQTYWAPTFILSGEQDLDKRSQTSMEYAIGMQWDPDNFQRSYFTTVNMEYDFNPVSTVYADYYLLQPESGPTDMRVDIGVNRGIAPNLQFDFSTGVGLTPGAPEFFFNIGFIFSNSKWGKKHKPKIPIPNSSGFRSMN